MAMSKPTAFPLLGENPMPHYRAFADEWPEYADEWSDADEPVTKKPRIEETCQHEKTPTPSREEPVAAGGNRSSNTASEDEYSGPITSSFKSSGTSYTESLHGMLLEGLTEYVENGKHKQERRRDNQPEWIEISDDEDDDAVKEEPTPSEIEANLNHQPPASDTAYPDESLIAVDPGPPQWPERRAVFSSDPARPTVCIVCHRAFAHMHSMREHYEQAHPRRNGFCTTCGQQFDRRSRLEKHLRFCSRLRDVGRMNSTLVIPEPFERNTSDVEGTVSTDVMPKVLSMNDLDVERMIAAVATPESLEQDASSLPAVSEEQELNVPSYSDQPHPPVARRRRPEFCESCNRSYADRATFNRHWRQVHLKIRAHQCHECGKRFHRKE
ncbi:hypothetical protein LTR13_007646 [Exophiala sideris]|uniref:C2H2-type domain-containing protein n=1 Tax=Exophiala sideris TaxID=1016849 RepID=A0ABR0J7T8_9EURO|nr:hypothetical protein LTR13_007646 [Exophiala sideris]KAK5058334.1 hypothetical protein LTR69_006739 [Exophiala sideris]KAK5180263.1 hypothetical protein LTR44_007389 [Eurotiomycetes sp. CCFEE 6388]